MSNIPTYKGFRLVNGDELAAIFHGEIVPTTNEYLYEPDADKVYRWDGERILPIEYTHLDDFKPKNVQQKMLFDLLDNNDIPIKAAVGIAGSGKTKAALKYGLHKVMNREFHRLLIVKQAAPVGEDIGFLSGDKTAKVRNWMGSIYDNMDEQTIQRLTWNGQIEFDVVAHMQGRDITNSFIIIDEAQLNTDEQIKMLGSRCSSGSVITFCGDYEQVFNKKYKVNNGLISMINNLSGEPEVGVVTLTESVRSRVSQLFATKM